MWIYNTHYREKLFSPFWYFLDLLWHFITNIQFVAHKSWMHFVILPLTDLGEFKNGYFVKLYILHYSNSFSFPNLRISFLEFYKTRWLQLTRTWVQYLGTGLSKRSSTLFSLLSSLSSSSTFSLPWSSLLSTSWERQNWRTTWTKIKSLVLISPFKPNQCSFMFPQRRQEYGNVWNTVWQYCLPRSNSI